MMLQAITRLLVFTVLLSGKLLASDNRDTQKLEEPVATPLTTSMQQPNPEPIPAPEAMAEISSMPMLLLMKPPLLATTEPTPVPGLSVSLQKGKITFELPVGFSDQTKLTGIVNNNQSTIQLFLDGKARQRAVTTEEIPPPRIKLTASDTLLKDLTQNMMAELAYSYQNIKTTKEQDFSISTQKFYRLDTEETVNGQPLISTIILTMINKRIVSLQMLSPAKTPEAHQALVQRIIDTMVVK